ARSATPSPSRSMWTSVCGVLTRGEESGGADGTFLDRVPVQNNRQNRLATPTTQRGERAFAGSAPRRLDASINQRSFIIQCRVFAWAVRLRAPRPDPPTSRSRLSAFL